LLSTNPSSRRDFFCCAQCWPRLDRDELSCVASAAIQAKGRTVAVLGTPITSCYPPENKDLQRLIADEYLVISQVPIIRYSQQGPKGNWCFFPERNVTMSALTEATVIVEAGNLSGALIQARHAIQPKTLHSRQLLP
jgi:predicted Rossmann fold nucleotide-binding protein DprA/Smf involved in DNA uptake